MHANWLDNINKTRDKVSSVNLNSNFSQHIKHHSIASTLYALLSKMRRENVSAHITNNTDTLQGSTVREQTKQKQMHENKWINNGASMGKIENEYTDRQ